MERGARYMGYEIKEELEILKDDVNKQQIKTGNISMYLDETHYEDDYSGNEIREMQEELLYHAKKYLQENHSGKYAIQIGGYAVVVITKEHYDTIGWKHGWKVC